MKSALGAGFNNVTNHENPTVIDNTLDSPKFLTFAGSVGRLLTARVRRPARK